MTDDYLNGQLELLGARSDKDEFKLPERLLDILFIRILFACGPLEALDDLLAGALRCISHRPLLGGYDEP
ncbi:hypothetical protein [Shimia sagamensis]|uniref:Uncharacterized protein n=1 Tax=Shimia sagamensis TaxID=1566352 RepID=A0ABY1NN75_9RHOB|nr:hypothetical protein [Shimia sagamensis]SMP14084.1 hypothetical protein SAMN06265373_102619 [Shimia sagamensis]